ncbi:MAG TPA: hypothetical protein VMV14_00745 [Acidimicrobiales bacterium]|nr:hypothetical protein [Acidimicrobiales bacterium]
MIAPGNHGNITVLVVAVALATTVEMVEALTIVLATGLTRGWRSTAQGAGAALVLLSALVLVLGPAIRSIPLTTLRIVIGLLLLVFGLQWLRKAVLRAAGLRAKHDEDEIFQRHVDELALEQRKPGRDSTAFTVAFKGVFLEGLEVVVIVLTLGTSSGHLALAGLVAGVAVVGVAIIGLIVSRQLAGVPENAMKMAVGVMLVSFGTFWTGEGVGAHWPGTDLAIPVLVLVYGSFVGLVVGALRHGSESRVVGR